jgi:hypothetical protein
MTRSIPGEDRSEALRIDLSSGEVLEQIDAGRYVHGPVAAFGQLWVPHDEVVTAIPL